jgi:hypothetical protein
MKALIGGLAVLLFAVQGCRSPSRPTEEPRIVELAPTPTPPKDDDAGTRPRMGTGESAEPGELYPRATVCRQLEIPIAGSDPATAAAQEKACRALTHHEGDFAGCRLKVLGNGAAVMLTIDTQCGGDSCSIRSWVCSKATGEILMPLAFEGGSIEASPDGSFLLLGDGSGQSRVDLPSMRRSKSASCLSPRLSPAGKWFACRSRDYDVLRFPVGGGALETVVGSGLKRGTGYHVEYAYVWAPAVTFVSESEIEYQVIAPPDLDERRRAPWRE